MFQLIKDSCEATPFCTPIIIFYYIIPIVEIILFLFINPLYQNIISILPINPFNKVFIYSFLLLLVKPVMICMFALGGVYFIWGICPVLINIKWTDTYIFIADTHIFLAFVEMLLAYLIIEDIEHWIYCNAPNDANWYVQSQLVFGHPIQAWKNYKHID